MSAKYYGNDKIDLRSGYGFGGYEDWVYQDFDARISILLDRLENHEFFDVGTYGLCISCGCEISHGLYCEDCDDDIHARCEQCGERCSETWTVHDRHGDEIEVCEDCLDDYSICDDCGEYHYSDNMHCVAGERYVCEGCFDSNYVCCDECGEYYHMNEGCLSLAYDRNRNEVYICESCRENEYEYCERCNETFHESLMHTTRDDGENEIRVCEDCLAEIEGELEEAQEA